jgi:hypothetical protein
VAEDGRSPSIWDTFTHAGNLFTVSSVTKQIKPGCMSKTKKIKPGCVPV